MRDSGRSLPLDPTDINPRYYHLTSSVPQSRPRLADVPMSTFQPKQADQLS